MIFVILCSLGYSAPNPAVTPIAGSPTSAIAPDLKAATLLRTAQPPQVVEWYGSLPLYFIENRGQVDKRVKYYLQSSGQTTFFTKDGLVLSLARPHPNNRPEAGLRPASPKAGPRAQPGFQKKPHSASQQPAIVRIKPVGLKKGVKITALEQTGHRVNYFIGNDPKKWRADIPSYLCHGVYRIQRFPHHPGDTAAG